MMHLFEIFLTIFFDFSYMIFVSVALGVRIRQIGIRVYMYCRREWSATRN